MAGENERPGVSPGLATGVELLGEYSGSGYREAPCLLRRGGRTMEVSPLLYLVCASLDGRRDLGQVAAEVSVRSGRHATAGDIAYLLEHKLEPLGVLAAPVTTARAATAHAVTALSVRRAVLPGAAVRRCTGPLRFLFRPRVVAAVLVAVAAMDAGILLGGDMGRGVGSLLDNPGLMLLLAALTLAAGVFHELGHATACRYGGAEPGVIGAGIYLIWPVFYNDLNDSYRLDRAGRLRADLGGIYFNAVFSLALGGAYLLTGFQPLVVAVAVQHLVVLQQFLPFVRLDGYYIISDLAGVPDLFGRIRPILSSLVPGRPAPPVVRQLKPGARAVVTAWVLVTVPALCSLLLVFVVHLPQLATSMWTSVGTRADSLLAAWWQGAVWGTALESVLLIVALVPPVGIALTVASVVRSKVASIRRSSAAQLAEG